MAVVTLSEDTIIAVISDVHCSDAEYASGRDGKRFEWLRAIDVVQSLGIEVDRQSELRVQWDGERIYALGQHPSSIVHDAAHLLVCTSRRRIRSLDFGLGAGPDTREHIPISVGYRHNEREEERASLLGILIELEIGLPAQWTARYHGWYWAAWRGAPGHIRWLHARGLLTSKGGFDRCAARAIVERALA